MDFSKDSSFRSVFVSNIPYEVSDDKLKEILGEVGHIVSFRMIMDTETFKPKGFAFCEFEDSGIANSAIRNLNGREVCFWFCNVFLRHSCFFFSFTTYLLSIISFFDLIMLSILSTIPLTPIETNLIK